MTVLDPPKPGSVPVDPSAGFVRAHISRVPYMPGLDGMRALAVVAVMIYHANPSWLPGGFLGVEMFFVISGYLITLLLIAERERTYRISLTEFWIRRARRLLPALFVMIGLLTIWTALFERDALGQLRGDVVAGFFYVSNWYQVWVGLGYTSAGDFAPLRHLWSLAVEEQFYLIWPLVMVAVLGRSGTRRVANFSRWLFLAAIGITVVVGLLYHPGSVAEPAQSPDAYWWLGDRPISKLDTLYLSTFARAGGLLLGSAFAMVWRPFAIVRGPLGRRGRTFDVVAALALVAFGWMCWTIHLVDVNGADGRLFRGGLFLSGVLTLLVIGAVAHQGAASNRLLGNRVLVWVGVRSYGLYLYHWPIYQIIRNVAGNRLRPHEFLLAMIATFIVTDVSYRFIETPIRTGRFGVMIRRLRRSRSPRPRRLLVGGVAVTAGLSLFAGVALATAELKQNDITESLGEGEKFTTDLTQGPPSIPPPAATPSTSVPVSSTSPPTTTPPPTTEAPVFVPVPTTSPAPATTREPPTSDEPGPTTTDAPVVVPASTVAPTTTLPPAPVTQLGVVTDVAAHGPLTVPVVDYGLPLVALGDSVMLGAAEELLARGFAVDAVKSRQMITFLPDMQVIREGGSFGPVVVIHLGTNGPFSETTLTSMMALVVDVPIVVVLTGKGDRDWIGSNNRKLRALPEAYPNVTVLDWEVVSGQCPGRCFYEDGIHLTQSGQDFYTSQITQLLGMG